MVDIPYYQTELNYLYLIYMYKKDFAVNNLQWLIKPNQIKSKPIKLQRNENKFNLFICVLI